MFFGSYEHSLDGKGRLVIPSKMREEAGDRVFIMKGFDGCLSIFKESSFEKLTQEFESLPYNKKTTRDYLRIQFASVCELTFDKSGRVQLPAQLLAKYQIGKEVVVIGAGDRIEVWDKKTFEEYEAKVETSFEETAETIGNND